MKKRLRQPHNIIIVLATIAVINAIYLVSVAYGGSSFCDINSAMSCSGIFSYSWAWILEIPFPMVAIIVYPLLALLAWKGRGYTKNSIRRRKLIRIFSGFGILFNGYFLYQEVITGVYCPFCLICLAIIVTIFFMSWRETHSIYMDQP